MRHHKRYENSIFLCIFGDIRQSPNVAVPSVTSANRTHVPVFAVLIPGKEVDTDIVHAHVCIMLEESVYVFLGARIARHNPLESPHILGVGIEDFAFVVPEQVAKCIFSARHLCIPRCMHPQRVIIYTHLKTLRLTHFHKVFYRHRAIVRHIRRAVLTVLGYETVSADHVVTIRFQVFSQPVGNFLPLLRSDVHVFVFHAILRLRVAIFVNAPIEGSLEVMYLLDGRKIRKHKFLGPTHLNSVCAARQRSYSECGYKYIHYFHFNLISKLFGSMCRAATSECRPTQLSLTEIFGIYGPVLKIECEPVITGVFYLPHV